MENESLIRFSIFLGLLVALIAAETLLPRRQRALPRKTRWFTNFGITVLNTVTINLMSFVLPVLAVGAAIDASMRGSGLLNWFNWPSWIEFILAVLILDFVIWAQHLITHKIPLLWRLHRVHHADRDMDVTTAIRFHPIEIALSMILKIGVVYLLGPAAVAVIFFEILLNGTAMFNHANLKLPSAIDRIIRTVLVTPDMHRIHHSIHRHEHDSNYGFALSIWDRIFRTYHAKPQEGHEDMLIGLHWQDDRPAKLGWSLALPFFRK